MKKKTKKMTIVYVLRMLQEATNPTQPITQSLITKTLNLLGIKCDRRTVAHDIDTLILMGYKIHKIKGGGCYVEEKVSQFTMQDYRDVVGCVNESSLDFDKKITLQKKLKALVNMVEW